MVTVRQIALDGYDSWRCRSTKTISLPEFSTKAIKKYLGADGPAYETGLTFSKRDVVISAMHEEGGDIFVLVG